MDDWTVYRLTGDALQQLALRGDEGHEDESATKTTKISL
jgi:hypothetical protein